MAKNFNVDPYYDDFSQSKNFHRILFKPGFAVQARELTQSQTILQDQITKFADHIFQQNSLVNGGNVTSNLNCQYVKLQPTYGGEQVSGAEFNGKLVSNATGSVLGLVVAVAEPTGGIDINGNPTGDPATLIISYRSGNHFVDGDVVYDTSSNLAAQAESLNATGDSSVASIDVGVFYVLGNFVQIPQKQTTVLSKYTNTPSCRVGLTISETILDYVNDPSLLDPALGASNYQAPGADRYSISLTLSTRPLQLGDDSDFIELVRFDNGQMFKVVDGTAYSTIDDYFAKRTYETNGDYTVTDFKITPKINPDNDATFILNVGTGIAYVAGYRIDNSAPLNIVVPKARTTQSQNTTPVYTDYGNYFYVDNVFGANGSFFDTTSAQTVDLHCITSANGISVASTAKYNSTKVGSAVVRGLVYENDMGSSAANNWIYKMYISDVQANTISGVARPSGKGYIDLPTNDSISTVDGAYNGATITLTGGTNAGETRTIKNYDGSNKVAYVSPDWSVAPDSTTKFTLTFGTKDVESLMITNGASTSATILSKAKINPESKVNGLLAGDTILENSKSPEMIFPIGHPYVASISDTSYSSYQEFRGVSFSGTSTISAQLSYSGSYSNVVRHFGGATGSNHTLEADEIKRDFTIVVTNSGTSGLPVGTIVPWHINGRTVTLNGDASIATLATSSSDIPGSFTANILVRCLVLNADNTSHILKIKNLISPNTSIVNTSGTQVNTYTFVDDSTLTSTGQVYIQHAGLVSPGSPQSLYLSDVKAVAMIIDSGSPATIPTVDDINNFSKNVTADYIFDNGQKDNYYDHASITLRPGASQPKGNILVLVSYYQHSGGDGYFSERSYTDLSSKPEQYRQISNYVARNGINYALRDCLDFRPARKNAQALFQFNYSNTGSTGGPGYGVFLPIDLSLFYCGRYSYYLARRDKLVITKDRSIKIISGTPAINPILPTEPEGSLIISNLTLNPYTGYIPTEVGRGAADLSIEMIQHKRYTMQDISNLEGRINRIEYYTTMNSLEQSASGMQIHDAQGLNRFKNGLLVDDFSSMSTADTTNPDYKCNINQRLRQLTAIQGVQNFSFTNLLMAYNLNKPSQTLLSSLDYVVKTDGNINNYLLPYTETPIIQQKLASRVVNVNPFGVTTSKGVIGLTPNVDNWVDTKYNPSILITAPGLQIYSNTLLNDIPINLLSTGDWQTISSTKTLESSNKSLIGSSSATQYQLGTNHGEGSSLDGHECLAAFKAANPNLTDAQAQVQFDNQYAGGYYGCATTTTTSTYSQTDVYNNTITQQKNYTYGPYSSISNTYSMNNGFVTDVSILPYIRPQEISITAKDFLINTQIYNFFDNENVDNYVKKPNTLEVTIPVGSSTLDNIIQNNKFKYGDIIGYKSSPTSPTFNPMAAVVGVYNYPVSSTDTSVKQRLYVTGESFINSNKYDGGTGIIYNATFNQNGVYTSSSASGTLTNFDVNSGRIAPVVPSGIPPIISHGISYPTGGVVPSQQISTDNIILQTANLSSVVVSSNYFVGNTVYINSGSGVGQSAQITSSTTYQTFNFVTGIKVTLDKKIICQASDTFSLSKDGFNTNEEGTFYGIFNIPPNKFQNGPRTYHIDNRINNDQQTSTTYGDATFYASGLQATKQRLDFGAAPATYTLTETRQESYKTTVTSTSTKTSVSTHPWDPVAQSFIIDSKNYPYGAFLSNIKCFFRKKASGVENTPVSLSIVGTTNGYPNGDILPHSYVSVNPSEVKISNNPQFLDPTTYTQFTFSVPVFIQPDTLYAFILRSGGSTSYEAWTAMNSDTALPSSVKNLPTDQTPTSVTKISATPYIGNLFLSQNAQTWTADQNQSLMFTVDRCYFDTTKNPNIRFVIPKGLPGRQLIEQGIDYFIDANNVSTTISGVRNGDLYFDALNLTTTDLSPTSTNIDYSYSSVLQDGTPEPIQYCDPGKYGTTMYEHIYLNDGNNERVLRSNSTTSFSLYASLSSADNAVSPVISESGLTLYTIEYGINNCELSNSQIVLANTGQGYFDNSGISNVSIRIDPPTGRNGVQAYAAANVNTASGIINSVYITYPGSGYVTTPNAYVLYANTMANPTVNATVTIAGETSPNGGPAYVKYFTKKVVLSQGFDSGDLQVFMTAYRPINTNILVYYKVLNAQDTQKFEDGNWTLMTMIQNSDTLYSYNRNDLYEFVFAPGVQDSNAADGYVQYTNASGHTFNNFNQFALKVVLVSTDKTYVPFISDLRAVALPENR